MANTLLALPNHEIHLWSVSLDQAFEPSVLDVHRSLLSAEETARYQQFVHHHNRLQFLMGRALLRTLLSRYVHLPPTAWVLHNNRHGKPFLAEPTGYSHFQFNLSHTDGLVVCALTLDQPIGIDVENLTARHISTELVSSVLSPTEMAMWQQLPECEKTRVFFDHWTLKEAYLKARGAGMSLPLKELTFTLTEENVRATFGPTIQDDPVQWQWIRMAPTAQHRLAIAVRRSEAHDLDWVVREMSL